MEVVIIDPVMGGSTATGAVASAITTHTGLTAAPGDSSNFQSWYRDSNAMGMGSNLTNGLEVTFN